MKKIVAVLLLSGSFCFGQQNPEIEKPVKDLFSAMKSADPELLQSVFSETAVLQTIAKDGVKTEDLKKFITSISGFAKGDLDERFII